MTALSADGLSSLPDRRRLSVDRINRHFDAHGVATDRVVIGDIDRARPFTCDSLCPLSHAPVFASLSDAQRLRYNQLVGLMQNEWICFFEQEFAVRVLPALLRSQAVPAELARSLADFVEDERRHTQLFRRLNRAAEPAWYAASDYHVLRVPAAFRAVLRALTRRPDRFPMVLWVMLLMEERSLMLGRRYAAHDAAAIEPHFAAAYRAHLEDEVRHVQLDWHLLERFYQSRPRWLRVVNARLLEAFVVGLFLKPRRANVRLVELLIHDFPELQTRRAELLAAVRGLHETAGYREMMYSADATPIGRALFERLPEFDRLRRKLYVQPEAGR